MSAKKFKKRLASEEELFSVDERGESEFRERIEFGVDQSFLGLLEYCVIRLQKYDLRAVEISLETSWAWVLKLWRFSGVLDLWYLVSSFERLAFSARISEVMKGFGGREVQETVQAGACLSRRLESVMLN